MEAETHKTTIDKMELFPFFREFFNSTGDWYMISDKVKQGHSFMLKRFLVIKYPQIAQMLNNINSPRVVDALHDMFSRPNGQSPNWMYTKSDKKKSDSKETLSKYSDWTVNEFRKYLGMDNRDIEYILNYHIEDSKKLLDSLEKGYKQSK